MDLAAVDGPVRVVGGGTKLDWAVRSEVPAERVSTAELDRVLEHNAGDLTAVIEAGVPLADAQRAFAETGQMLALDPPDPGGATVGGVVASGDSGPLRSRYGGARDLVVGMKVALADGTVARSGGKVIKNVAGYDLAKLFCGSYGTLGAILELSVRLHPLPPATATAVVHADDPDALAERALALTHAPLEHQGLDVRWRRGRGAVLARFGGVEPVRQARAVAGAEIVEDDDGLWAEQRAGQRGGTVVRVSGRQTELPRALRAADRHGAALVGRAPLALWWLRFDGDPPAPAELRRELAPMPCVVLDGPPGIDRVGELDGEPLMRRVKERFDPDGRLAPGVLL